MNRQQRRSLLQQQGKVRVVSKTVGERLKDLEVAYGSLYHAFVQMSEHYEKVCAVLSERGILQKVTNGGVVLPGSQATYGGKPVDLEKLRLGPS